MALSADSRSRKVPAPLPTHLSWTLYQLKAHVILNSTTNTPALWVADNFVPVGGGDAITAVGYKSELSNNVTVRYSFFSYNRSLDVSVGLFSPLERSTDIICVSYH